MFRMMLIHHVCQADRSTSVGYLNAFLLKKRQQEQSNVQQLIARFEKTEINNNNNSTTIISTIGRSSTIIKPTKGILQRRINGTITPIPK